ncbi:hypothetical protein [Modestobacter lapidis]|nr:hypothetical protein [Modestobacter lapidis]
MSPSADPYAGDPARPVTSGLRPWWRWLFLLPGLAAVLYGGYGLLTAGSRIPLSSWATWFLGSALLHDLVIAPLWIGLGWLAARFLPGPARAPVVVAAAVSGVLTLVTLPFLLTPGNSPANPSFLPREYGRNLLLVVLAVWVVAAAWSVVAVRRARTAP